MGRVSSPVEQFPEWLLDSLKEYGSWLVAIVGAAAVVRVMGWVWWRWRAASAVGSRVSIELRPTTTFDAGRPEVAWFAGSSVQGVATKVSLVKGTGTAFADDRVPSGCPGAPGRLYTARAELVLAEPDHRPLAAKIRAYARYLDYVPMPPPGHARTVPRPDMQAWRDRYIAFPRLLLVLTGATPRALARRTEDVRALAAADVRLQQVAGRLLAGITTLDLLRDRRPFAPVVTPVFGPAVLTDCLLGAGPVDG